MKYLPLVTEMQHPVFSRNLFYPGTALLCSILSFSGIYSVQELLCSAASCVFQESIPSRNCSGHASSCLFQESILSRNCSALHHPVFSGIYFIQELLCSVASCLFQKSILSMIQELLCSEASCLTF